MNRKKRKHFTLPAPSTSNITGVRLTFPGDVLELRFDYVRNDTIYRRALLFDKTRAHHHEAEIYVPAWKIEYSYDTLVQILDSPWVEELEEGLPEDLKELWNLNHYMIYFDSDGCFEVIADTWTITPEENGSW